MPDPLGHAQVFISAARIRGRVQQLGRQLSRYYAGKSPLAVILLDGAMTFAADLLRAVSIPGLRSSCLRVSSYYGGMFSSGSVEHEALPCCDGAEVLLIDDILDSGHTLARISQGLLAQGAAEVCSCVLLDKPGGRQTAFAADWVGFTVPPLFLVGYGLDYQGSLRQLPDICRFVPADSAGDDLTAAISPQA